MSKLKIGIITTLIGLALSAFGNVVWDNHNRSTTNAVKHVDEVKRSTGVDNADEKRINFAIELGIAAKETADKASAKQEVFHAGSHSHEKHTTH